MDKLALDRDKQILFPVELEQAAAIIFRQEKIELPSRALQEAWAGIRHVFLLQFPVQVMPDEVRRIIGADGLTLRFRRKSGRVPPMNQASSSLINKGKSCPDPHKPFG